MPRLRQVSRHDTTDPLVLQMYDFLFGDRDPVVEPGTATGTPGNWWTVFAQAPAVLDHMVAGFGLFSSPERELSPALRELALTRTGFAAQSQFVFSQHCKAARDCGFTEEQVKADVQRFLDDAMAADPELNATLEWNLMVGATEIDGAHPVVRSLSSAAEVVLGRTPRLGAFPGATDAAYIQMAAGVPCVASFGPGMLPRAHSPNEAMNKSGAAEAAMIYALASLHYLNDQRGNRT